MLYLQESNFSMAQVIRGRDMALKKDFEWTIFS